MVYNLDKVTERVWMWDDTSDAEVKDYANQMLSLVGDCKGIRITSDYEIEFGDRKYTTGKKGELNIKELINMFKDSCAFSVTYPSEDCTGWFTIDLPMLFSKIHYKKDLDYYRSCFITIFNIEASNLDFISHESEKEYWDYFSHVISTRAEFMANKYNYTKDVMQDWIGLNFVVDGFDVDWDYKKMAADLGFDL